MGEDFPTAYLVDILLYVDSHESGYFLFCSILFYFYLFFFLSNRRYSSFGKMWIIFIVHIFLIFEIQGELKCWWKNGVEFRSLCKYFNFIYQMGMAFHWVCWKLNYSIILAITYALSQWNLVLRVVKLYLLYCWRIWLIAYIMLQNKKYFSWYITRYFMNWNKYFSKHINDHENF